MINSANLSIENDINDWFTALFNDNPSIFAISKIESGEFSQVNNAFLKTFQFEHEEVIGKTSRELNLFLHHKNRVEMIHEIELFGFVKNKEIYMLDKSGKMHICLFTANFIQINKNKIWKSITSLGLDYFWLNW